MKLLLNVTFTFFLLWVLLFCSCNKDGISWNLSRNNPNDSLVNGEIQITKHSLTFWYSSSDFDYYSLKIYIKNYDDKVIENIYYKITSSIGTSLNFNYGPETGILIPIGNINPYEEKLLFKSPYDLTIYLRVLKGAALPSNIPFNIEITYGGTIKKSFQINV